MHALEKERADSNWVFIGDVTAGDGREERVVWHDERTGEPLGTETLSALKLVPPPSTQGTQRQDEDEDEPPEEVLAAHYTASYRNSSRVALAVTGKAFALLCRDAAACDGHQYQLQYRLYLRGIMERLVVAARFSPSQKQR